MHPLGTDEVDLKRLEGMREIDRWNRRYLNVE